MANIAEKMKAALKSLQNATSEYATMGGLSVNVGLPSDRIHEPSGLTLAELGAIHEFGAGNIPERSFLRSLPILKKTEIKKAMTVQAEKSARGESAIVLMEQFALFGQGLVQENIVDLKDPALKPATIKRRKKGSSNPLVDTGAMRQGVIGIVVSD